MKRFLFFLLTYLLFANVNAQSVTITQPNGGEVLYGCQTYLIKWTSSGTSNFWNIDYSLNNGAIWTSVASDINITNGQYSWTVPMVSSTTVLVRVRDFSDTTKQDVSNAVFTIQKPITITAPNGGETWQGLTTHTISWNPAGTSGVFNIYYSVDNGTTFITVATNVAANNYSWTVPNNPSTTAIVKVADATTSCQLDLSDAAFTISPAQPVLTAPNGGQVWRVSSYQNITWTANTLYTTVYIEYSTDNGTSWNLVAGSAPNTGSYTWQIPNTPSSQVLVRISNVGSPTPRAISAAVLSIVLPKPVIIAPNGGEVWRSANTQTITWDTTTVSGTVKLEYSTNNGAAWNTITASTSNSGAYSWTVPLMNTTTQALVRLSASASATAIDTSNAVFTIKAPITLDYPTLITDTVTSCSTINIIWSKSTAFESNSTYYGYCYSVGQFANTYQLYYSVGNSGVWNNITTVTNVCAQQSYNYAWTVPDVAPGTIRIKVVGYWNTYQYGAGNIYWQDSSSTYVPFRNPSGTIVVTAPNSGATLNALTNSNITWTANGSTGYFDILYWT